MIGDQLTTDIFFGNLNNMATVWVNKYKDYFNKEKFKVEGFHENLLEPITENGYNEIHCLEAIKGEKMIKEESLFHKGLNKNL